MRRRLRISLLFTIFVSLLVILAGVLNPPLSRDSGRELYIAVAVLVLAAALAGLIHLQSRRGELPDFLRQLPRGQLVDANGLHFRLRVTVPRVDRQAHLELWYQNRHERPAEVRVAVQPVRESFRSAPELPSVTLCFDCGPAAVGRVRLPLAIPESLAGRRVQVGMGASVVFPQGKGRSLRFAIGLGLPSPAFRRLAETAVGLRPGRLGIPVARVGRLALPKGALPYTLTVPQPERVELWQLGDGGGSLDHLVVRELRGEAVEAVVFRSEGAR